MNDNDTICAVATAPGEAGIAVLRVSGPQSLSIARRVFSSTSAHMTNPAAGTFIHGTVHAPDELAEHIDDALLLIFKAPHSYTGEDSIELQCHGGTVCSRRILKALIEAGARQAEPGEFTRRAFLNGRMDLIQAEAVADLIHAQSDCAAKSALRQLEGSLSNWYKKTYDDIMSAAATFEATLDFPEDELPASIYEEPLKILDEVCARISKALETWNDGRLLQEGARVAIAGRPNAGKSSLFNALLGHDRAIVTHIAGTTRDTVEDSLVIGGLMVHLIDTAGLRESDCQIEAQGIIRAQKAIRESDLTLYVIDSSSEYYDIEMQELTKLDPSKTIVVLNKSDLPSAPLEAFPADLTSCRCSCLKGSGIDDLKAHITSRLDGFNPSELNSMNQRHRTKTTEALAELDQAVKLSAINPESKADLIATHLRAAATSIGSIIGLEYHKELLDNIFSRFCIGK